MVVGSDHFFPVTDRSKLYHLTPTEMFGIGNIKQVPLCVCACVLIELLWTLLLSVIRNFSNALSVQGVLLCL